MNRSIINIHLPQNWHTFSWPQQKFFNKTKREKTIHFTKFLHNSLNAFLLLVVFFFRRRWDSNHLRRTCKSMNFSDAWDKWFVCLAEVFYAKKNIFHFSWNYALSRSFVRSFARSLGCHGQNTLAAACFTFIFSMFMNFPLNLTHPRAQHIISS